MGNESGLIGTKEVTWYRHSNELQCVVDVYCHEKEEYIEGWCGMSAGMARKLYKEKIAELTNAIKTEHGYLLSEVRRTVRYRRVPLHGGTLGAKDGARRSKKEILQVWLCHAFQQW